MNHKPFLKILLRLDRDEGIILKDLGSKWEPSDRSGKWLKMKPEYIQATSDLDVLIIGLFSVHCSVVSYEVICLILRMLH